ncbi:GntR family transcriptional regulator [Pseudomonas sp. SWRI74]|uniref:GntR family transcriptional regulator n=1 Tax=Pseudomonas azerbaijanoccidentalis TaxID=2842347 RepID=A0ABS6QZM3_9PSED|nr:GntR family transcriptional regulator [Pseudomonas azerbaijanoccidentalis]MBV4524334.1 GntR family transcriptional regulator [Pseudomonas azerbaijanoccidentalis]
MCEVLLNALGPRPDRQVDGVFIAGQLALAITSGALPIGTKLSQQSIANHYGLSRMPVREALRCAQAKGLISYVPNHTPVVVASAANDDSDLAKALRLLEKCLPRLDRPNDELAPVVAEFLDAYQAGNGGDQ